MAVFRIAPLVCCSFITMVFCIESRSMGIDFPDSIVIHMISFPQDLHFILSPFEYR